MSTYATQMDAAKQGILTPEMETVAKEEHLELELVRERVAKGTICIPANIYHKSLHPYGIGEGLRTKINVNLGISGDCRDYSAEFEKVKLALKFNCEAIMDLSNYGKTKCLPQAADRDVLCHDRHSAHVRCHRLLGKGTGRHQGRGLPESAGGARQGGRRLPDHSRRHQPPCCRGAEAHQRTINIVSRGGSLLFLWMEMTEMKILSIDIMTMFWTS